MKNRALAALTFLALSGCMTPEPVPGWVLVCHDTGGGEGCPPGADADALESPSAEDAPFGPSAEDTSPRLD